MFWPFRSDVRVWQSASFACMAAAVLVPRLRPTLCDPWPVAHQAPLSVKPSGKRTGVGFYSLPQRIFPAQGWNPGHRFFTVWATEKTQHDSARGVPVAPPSGASLPPSSPSRPSRRYTAPVWVSRAMQQNPAGYLFTYGDGSFHVTLSIRLALSSPQPMSFVYMKCFKK